MAMEILPISRLKDKLYRIDNADLTVWVLRVDHQANVYRP
jgi:hypothetical protein